MILHPVTPPVSGSQGSRIKPAPCHIPAQTDTGEGPGHIAVMPCCSGVLPANQTPQQDHCTELWCQWSAMGRAGSRYPSRTAWVRMVTTHCYVLLHISSIPLPCVQSYRVPGISAVCSSTLSCIDQKVKCLAEQCDSRLRPQESYLVLLLCFCSGKKTTLPLISISPLKHDSSIGDLPTPWILCTGFLKASSRLPRLTAVRGTSIQRIRHGGHLLLNATWLTQEGQHGFGRDEKCSQQRCFCLS